MPSEARKDQQATLTVQRFLGDQIRWVCRARSSLRAHVFPSGLRYPWPDDCGRPCRPRGSSDVWHVIYQHFNYEENSIRQWLQTKFPFVGAAE